MPTLFRNLLFVLVMFLGVEEVSSQEKFTYLPVGKRALDRDMKVVAGVFGAEDNPFWVGTEFKYKAGSEPLQTAVERVLRELVFIPEPGKENGLYAVSVSTETFSLHINAEEGRFVDLTGEVVSVYPKPGGPNYFFRFERRDGRFVIPEKNLRFTFEFGRTVDFWIPTATDFEITVSDGKTTRVISTLTGQDELKQFCSLPGVANQLRWSGVLGLPSVFIDPNHPGRWWTSQTIRWSEGVKTVLWDTDGVPVEQSASTPAFFESTVPTKPEVRLSMRRLADGNMELSATGVTYLTLDMLEESTDLNLKVWTSPPRLLKKSSSEPRLIFQPGESTAFYRLRLPPEESTLSPR